MESDFTAKLEQVTALLEYLDFSPFYACAVF